MEILMCFIQISIRLIISYYMFIKIYEHYSDVKIDRLKKISIATTLLLFSVFTEILVPFLNYYIYFLYLIPLFIILKGILKNNFKDTAIFLNFISLFISLSHCLSYLVAKFSSYLININILEFLVYNLLFVSISILITNYLSKYIKNAREHIVQAIYQIDKKAFILISSIPIFFILVTILCNYFHAIHLNLVLIYIVCVFISLLNLYINYYIKSQNEIVNNQLYIKQLQSNNDSLRIIKHDYDNILLSINGYIATKEYKLLEEHLSKLTKESAQISNAQCINPDLINQPAVYGIIGSKYTETTNKHIKFNVAVDTDIKEINFDFSDLSRILGLLIDNAIEATEQAETKEMSIKFSYNKTKQADMIEVKNNIKSNLHIDLTKIYNKGVSSKKKKSGIGLWEVKNIISSNNNSQIYANVTENTFCHTIVIEKA